MSTTTSPSPTTTRRNLVPVRVGVVLGVILAVLQIITAVGQVGDGDWRVYLLLVLPFGVLIAAAFAWLGRRWAAIVVAVCSIAPTLTGLPVYFKDDIPAGAVMGVSIGIIWSLVVSALVLLPRRSD